MKGYVPWSGTKFYHSLYCGLATAIGDNFGYKYRVIISFEMVLLTVLMFAVHGNIWDAEHPLPANELFVERRCCLPGIIQPMPKRTDLLNPIAGLSMFFVELATLDKLRDSRSASWQILRAFLKRRFRKARALSSQWFGKEVTEEIRHLSFQQKASEKLILAGGELEWCWSISTLEQLSLVRQSARKCS